MKLEPIANPSQPQVNGAKAEITGGNMSARERAIARLMDSAKSEVKTTSISQNQPTPVPNPSSVSPEEMGALRTSTKAPTTESVEQNYSNEEAPKAQATEETKPAEEPLSPRLAALARREKAIRLREQQLKAREAELTKPKAPEKPAEPAFDPSKYIDREKILKDPFGALNELGLTYDQLTERLVNGPSYEQQQLTNEIKALKAEIESLKGETQNTKKSFEESQKQQMDQAINQIRNEVKHLVNADPNFETVKETGSVDDVVDLIKQTFEQDGYLMSVEEAAQEVENYLLEEALKLTRINKIQQKLKPAAPAPAPKPTVQPEQPQLKTLTNSVSTSRQLNAKERAILAFQGKLQK